MEIAIPLDMPLMSTNNGLVASNWQIRNRYVQRIKEYTSAALDELDLEIIVYPVDTEYQFQVKKQRVFDPSNYSWTAKAIEDALIGRVLIGDSRTYVKSVKLCEPVKMAYLGSYNACVVKLTKWQDT